MKKKYWRLMIGLFLIPCFFCFSFAFASTSVNDLKIPAQFGTIKEVFTALNQTPTSERTIIQIQDAHCNYEAQKNLIKILEYLVKENNLKLILVEGGSGNVSLSFLRNYADKKAREEVADTYLKEGKISGEEYLDIVSDSELELYGVEDEGLYDSNLNTFLELDSYRQEALKNLDNLHSLAEKLKPYIYGLELSEFERKKTDYEDKILTLTEYCGYLKGVADKKGVALKVFPHLAAFVESARLEKTMDFKAAEGERNSFIKELGKLLDEKNLQELLVKSQDYKAGKIKTPEYYAYLSSLAQYRIDIKTNYPQLASYIDYVTGGKDIDAKDLLKEIPLAEDKIRGALAVQEDEKRFIEISKSLGLLTKYFKLDLTPEDYANFKADKANISTASWLGFLKDYCQKYNLPIPEYNVSLIDENFAKLDDFYKLGLEREKSFIKNIENKMNQSQIKLAVLITGGFHTPGISRMLKEKGYSYAVVTPIITKQSDPNLYFSVLRDEKKKIVEPSSEESSKEEPLNIIEYEYE